VGTPLTGTFRAQGKCCDNSKKNRKKSKKTGWRYRQDRIDALAKKKKKIKGTNLSVNFHQQVIVVERLTGGEKGQEEKKMGVRCFTR